MFKNNLDFPRVSIIILNWNGWKDTIECLESLYQIEYQNYAAIVVENGSKDESIEKIRDYCNSKIKVKSRFFKYNVANKPISIIEYTKNQVENGRNFQKEKNFSKLPSNRKLIMIKNKKNYGFAEGNNIAIRYVLKILKPDYLLLLNNDTVVKNKFLNDLIEFAESDEMIGIAGPEIRFYSNPNNVQFEDKFANIKIPTEVDWVSGSVFLIKSKLIKTIGLLDPIFHLYFEETDYIARAKNSGYKVAYVPTKNYVLHKFSASVRKIRGLTLYYMTRNHIIFKKKHSNKREFRSFLFRYFKKELKTYLKSLRIYFFLKGILTGIMLSFTR